MRKLDERMHERMKNSAGTSTNDVTRRSSQTAFIRMRQKELPDLGAA
jgi:hypothetical protein